MISTSRTRPSLRRAVAVPTLLLATVPVDAARAGSFVFNSSFVDAVTHGGAYDGSGGVWTVKVCVDPAAVHAASLRVPVRNTLSTWNALAAASPNLIFGASNDIPTGRIDAESVLAHEVGHCIGLAHVNVDVESGGLSNYTAARSGANGMFDTAAGVDGVIGSCDDLRGDDVNVHWFNRQSNNPYLVPATVDTSTYSRNLAHLPTTPAQCSGSAGPGSGPHSFAANADRAVGARLGFPNTEAVMQQGIGSDEDQRALTADDVATLRFARSGLDGTAGTADDYTLQLVWGGLTTAGCAIVVRESTSGFASCTVSGVFRSAPANTHLAVTSGTVTMNSTRSWHFDQDLACSLDIDGNSQVTAFTDGLLAFRYLLGQTGSSLTAGAVGPGATRTTAAAIIAYLESCRLPMLDADGTGTSVATTDGVLLMRHLLEFQGSALIAGAVGGTCARCTAAQISAVLAGLSPDA